MINKKLEKFFQIVIIISLALTTAETLPSLKAHQHFFDISETFTASLFLIEYLLRIKSAKNKTKFIFGAEGIMDLIAFLPSLLMFTNIDLRSIRVIRIFRIARIFKFARYSKSLDRLTSAFKDIKMELIVFSTISLAIIYISSVGIYYFENSAQPEHFKSIPHCFWWSIVTLTTVGYGDAYPVTLGGKIFTSILLILGLGIISIPSALLASALSKKRNE